MTKKQRREHIESLKQVLVDKGFEQDQWGNYKHPSVLNIRAKFKKVNLRLERKTGDSWHRTSGGVLTRVTVGELKFWCNAQLKIASD